MWIWLKILTPKIERLIKLSLESLDDQPHVSQFDDCLKSIGTCSLYSRIYKHTYIYIYVHIQVWIVGFLVNFRNNIKSQNH